MFEKAIVVNGINHREKGVRRQSDYLFASRVTSAPLGWSEVSSACLDMPIVFTKDGPLLPVAQLGAALNKNAFVGQSGEWLGRYVPAHIRRFPFVLGDFGSDSVFKLMVAKDELVPSEQGVNRLFEDSGEESNFLKVARGFVVAHQADVNRAAQMCLPLRTHSILVDSDLEFFSGAKMIGRVTRTQIVDRDRLKKLPDSVLASWSRNGLLDLVALHLLSLKNGIPVM